MTGDFATLSAFDRHAESGDRQRAGKAVRTGEFTAWARCPPYAPRAVLDHALRR
jgi:hypothetical protein